MRWELTHRSGRAEAAGVGYITRYKMDGLTSRTDARVTDRSASREMDTVIATVAFRVMIVEAMTLE